LHARLRDLVHLLLCEVEHRKQYLQHFFVFFAGQRQLGQEPNHY
jgi:hypothetical protein